MDVRVYCLGSTLANILIMRFSPAPAEEDVERKHFLPCAHYVCQGCADTMVRTHCLASHDDIRCPVCRMMVTKICTFICFTQSDDDSGQPLFLGLVVR